LICCCVQWLPICRVDTKFRETKFRNKNYFSISRNGHIISRNYRRISRNFTKNRKKFRETLLIWWPTSGSRSKSNRTRLKMAREY
jgi:hypothetical protein